MTLPISDTFGVARGTAAFTLIAVLACGTLLGCSSGPPALRPPDIDPQDVAVAAMEQYDKNADGKIDDKELKSAPSLLFCAEQIDANDDSQITSEEIAAYAQKQWVDRASGLIRVRCEIVANGNHLEGATVVLEPEAFMGGVVKPASGVTKKGRAYLDVSEDDRPNPNAHGVQNGLYLVRVSRMVNGKETIPDKFNTNTILGCEIATGASYMPGPLIFNLSAK